MYIYIYKYIYIYIYKICIYVCVVCVSLCVYGRIILHNQFPINKLINETFARPSKTLLITRNSSAKDVQYKKI